MWSETARLCLKRKTKPFNFLACSCHNIFQVIVIFLVCSFFLFLSQTQRHVWCWEGCNKGLKLPRRDLQHPEGINEPLTTHLRSVLPLKRCCLSSACYFLAFISILFSICEPNACKSPQWRCRRGGAGGFCKQSVLGRWQTTLERRQSVLGGCGLYWGDGTTSCDASYLSFMGLSLHPRWPFAGDAATRSLGTSLSHVGMMDLPQHPHLLTRFHANPGQTQLLEPFAEPRAWDTY